MPTTPIQAMSVKEVLQAMDSSPEGLSSLEAESRLSLYGRNSLHEQPKTPIWQKTIDHFKHPVIWVTVGASLIAAIIGDWILALVILILSFANSIFLFWREYRAEQAIQKLQLILPIYAHIIRNGQETQANAQEIVPGDVLILEEGDNIPTDARVIEEYGLRTNNATLPGEALPSRKIADPSFLMNGEFIIENCSVGVHCTGDETTGYNCVGGDIRCYFEGNGKHILVESNGTARSVGINIESALLERLGNPATPLNNPYYADGAAFETFGTGAACAYKVEIDADRCSINQNYWSATAATADILIISGSTNTLIGPQQRAYGSIRDSGTGSLYPNNATVGALPTADATPSVTGLEVCTVTNAAFKSPLRRSVRLMHQ